MESKRFSASLMTQERIPAVVLLSGGLDSATCLAIAKDSGHEIHAISFRYGQRHEEELNRAAALAASMHAASHRIIDIDLAQLGGSALVDASIAVPKADRVEDIGDAIPVTYVPARNTIFLSYALAVAETIQSIDIFIGVNALDYSGYPDCRPEFIEAFQSMARLATKAAMQSKERLLTIHTPLIDLTKGEIIAEGLRLGVDYSKTLSCYDPVDQSNSDGRISVTPCRHCDACLLREKGFRENEMTDPSITA